MSDRDDVHSRLDQLPEETLHHARAFLNGLVQPRTRGLGPCDPVRLPSVLRCALCGKSSHGRWSSPEPRWAMARADNSYKIHSGFAGAQS
jgi:hypothetical protein